jgi:2-methylcitrate dehydratase PrpD
VTPEVLDRTKLLLLDYLGVACGGLAFGESSPAFTKAVARLAGGARGPATVVGAAEGFPVQYAALLNGAYAHSMDFDDTHRDAVTHPGTPLFAALLAAGEAKGAGGRALIEAAVVGYEVNGRLGRAHGDRVHQHGFHPTATTGIFAVTAALGRLAGVGPAVVQQALGLDLSLAAGTAQFNESGGANKPLQVGMAAHHALCTLEMARVGVPGTGLPLEGSFGYFNTFAGPGVDPAGIELDPASASEVLTVAVKPYPACRYSHSTIDGMQELMQREALTSGEIESIEIALSPAGYLLVGSHPEIKRRPASIVDAQFSAYFAAAATAAGGGYSWDSYRGLQDPQVLELMDRTRVRAAPEVPGMAAEIALTSRRGSWTLRVPLPKGEPELPVSWAEVEAKFRSLATGLLGPERADQVVAMVHRMEELPDVRQLMGPLRG